MPVLVCAPAMKITIWIRKETHVPAQLTLDPHFTVAQTLTSLHATPLPTEELSPPRSAHCLPLQGQCPHLLPGTILGNQAIFMPPHHPRPSH
ncbi:hypothetical protein J6590_049431 [Homalodisca vitripennis]|nr:hypothetical protein J6590_049431 [Homalodisca vitripennis]